MRRLRRGIGHGYVGEVVLSDGLDCPCVCALRQPSCHADHLSLLEIRRTDCAHEANDTYPRHGILEEIWSSSAVEGGAGLVAGVVVGGLRYSEPSLVRCHNLVVELERIPAQRHSQSLCWLHCDVVVER